MALRNEVIAYNNGSVTKIDYQGFSAAQKTAYQNFLRVLLNNEAEYGNARWLLTYEIYIPSGVTVNIPAGVTLVANGGLFSGEGTILSFSNPNNIQEKVTKIEAGFEQIFEDTLQFKVEDPNSHKENYFHWDVSVVHPEWFGVIDILQGYNFDNSGSLDIKNIQGDSSLKIQKAIDLITACTNFLITDPDPNTDNRYFMFTGGKVVCKPYSTYNIQNTIYLPLGVSFDGGDSNFIYDILDNNNPYMFKVNMLRDGSDNWAMGERGQMDVICNIQMINPNQKPNAYGIYSASQLCTFENIRSQYFCQTFKRHSEYIDNLTLRNFTIGWSRKNSDGNADYQIDMSYIGDNLLVDNVSFFVEDNLNANDKLLHVNACGGGIIQRITNGTIHIENSKSLTISGIHQEFGNIILQNSQVEINGMAHFKHPGQPAFIIKNRDVSYEHRTVELKNVMILYNLTRYGEENIDYHLSPYSPNELDIELYWLSGAVKIENVFRSLQRPWTEASNLYGIRVNNNAFMKNPAANSISSIVISSSDTSGDTQNYDETIKGVLLNNHIAYQITKPGSYGSILDACFAFGYDAEFGANRYFPAGTYTYRAAVVLDRTRNIGYYFNEDWAKKEITVNLNQSSCIYLSFYRHYYVGMYIRLFRKKSGTGTTDYIDIPVCASHNIFYDLGNITQFGETWNTIEDVKLAALIPQTCYNYQFLGNNVYVKMPAMPTKGDWEQGDMIYLTSNNSLNVI